MAWHWDYQLEQKRGTHWEMRTGLSWEPLWGAGLGWHWDFHWERQMAD